MPFALTKLVDMPSNPLNLNKDRKENQKITESGAPFGCSCNNHVSRANFILLKLCSETKL